MLKLMLSVALSLLILGGVPSRVNCDEVAATPDQSDSTSVAKTAKLDNGLYLVRRQSKTLRTVEPTKDDETLLADDYHFLEPAEREPVRYVVLQKKPFIPLLLAAKPKEDREEATGKPRLQLELAEDQAKPLEEFTSAHLGKLLRS